VVTGSLKILLGGEGGQGVQSVAAVVAEAAYAEGNEVLYIPNFGVEQRGGVSIAFLQISDQPIAAPKFRYADVVVALSQRAVARTEQYVGLRTVFLHDSAVGGVEDLLAGRAARIIAIPALETCRRESDPKVFNMVIMGALLGQTDAVSLEGAKAAVRGKMGARFAKQPELRELNEWAIDRGMALVAARQ
jgi:2-oxoglutarate ferredoxin oxidoreductase subunit gamma